MKYICLVLFLFITTVAKENDLGFNNSPIVVKPTSFQKAFKRINAFEGYYVNHPLDKGKETYRGISRRYHSNWIGWSRVDNWKQVNGKPKWNQQIEEADLWVTDFYLSLWLHEKYDLINDHEIASYAFEFLIHGTDAKKVIRRITNKQFTKAITMKEVPYYLNYVDKAIFLKDLKQARLQYYNNIVKRDSTQSKFIKHWLSRVN